MEKTTGGKHPAQQQPAGQGGILQRAGMAAHGRSTKHAGSKPDYTHLTRPDQLGAYERAAAWSRETGRPLPPHMRIRTRPVREPRPMDPNQRIFSYLRGSGRSDSPAQLRRRRHKLGRLAAMERAGIKIIFKDRRLADA